MDKITTLHRKRLSQERGVIKKDWGGKLSVALIYPNHYSIGMSNLGFQAIYGILNDNTNIVSERVFLPDAEELSIYKMTKPPILSLESQAPLTKFDILAFSISFENDYLNILSILDLSKIPVLSKDREEGYPLIIAGGATTFMNPEPLADVIDCFLIGEGEVILENFFEAYIGLRLYDAKKREALEALARDVTGVYCPSLFDVEYNSEGLIASFEPLVSSLPHRVKVARNIPFKGPMLRSRIVTPLTEFSDTILVELNRGCGYSCRFCAAGYFYRPPRMLGKELVIESLKEILTENFRIGLISPTISDVPGIEDITGFVIEKGGSFSVSSMRADSLTEGLMENLKKNGQKTITMAPEAGSERLRRVINKKVTTEEIIDAIILITKTGFFHIKLYFMIGLPTETREDIKAIVSMVKSIRHNIIKESRHRKRIGRIRLSVNCFIPKPSTPFQWLPMDTVESLKEKQRLLKKGLSGQGGVNVSFDIPKWSYIQTLLSMGDRRVGKMLLATYKNGGNWKQTLRSSDVNPDFFVYRDKDLNERLPWDYIDNKVKKSFLQEEYNLAFSSIESPACRVGKCTRCGVCE
ncbi:MAG: radical SAM protein [Thermodesulfobacteriota bacterium]|nr:radical SAM protein [Thermodesulfobacteriota bacterium]